MILNFIEEYILTYGFRTANYPCYYKNKRSNNVNYNNNQYYYYWKQKENTTLIINENKRQLGDIDNDCSVLGRNYYTGIITVGEYLISYFTFSFLEVSLFLGIWIWYLLRIRIKQGIDGPLSNLANILPVQRGNIDQYGRQVVVIREGDVVYVDGQRHVAVPVQNQYNNPQYSYS